MAKPGRDYEDFVAGLYGALLQAELVFDGRNIEVEQNKTIIDNDGLEREFDVYWEYEIAGITYRTVIECKDYTSTISVDHIDGLLGKNTVHSRPPSIVRDQEGISIRSEEEGYSEQY